MLKKPFLVKSVYKKINSVEISCFDTAKDFYTELLAYFNALLIIGKIEIYFFGVWKLTIAVYISVNKVIGYKNAVITKPLVKFERISDGCTCTLAYGRSV